MSNWKDYDLEQPDDGEKILAYLLINNPDEEINRGGFFEHKGKTICGPMVLTFFKDFVEQGAFSAPAFWKPIDLITELNAT